MAKRKRSKNSVIKMITQEELKQYYIYKRQGEQANSMKNKFKELMSLGVEVESGPWIPSLENRPRPPKWEPIAIEKLLKIYPGAKIIVDEIKEECAAQKNDCLFFSLDYKPEL